VHQLTTLDAMNEAKDRIADAVGTGYEGKLEGCRCFPPTPSITMKEMTLGIHAKLSYLYRDRSTATILILETI
jgi:hypothetical protein